MSGTALTPDRWECPHCHALVPWGQMHSCATATSQEGRTAAALERIAASLERIAEWLAT